MKIKFEKKSIISLTEHVLHHPKTAAWMRELIPQDGKSVTPMSDQGSKGIEYQGSVGEFDLPELTDMILCVHCHESVISGQDYCHCGRSLKYESPSPAFEGQFQRFVKQRSELLVTAPALRKGPGRARLFGTTPSQIARGRAVDALENAQNALVLINSGKGTSKRRSISLHK